MKQFSCLRTLYRSPLKSGLVLLLLASTAFLFLYNLLEFYVSNTEYQKARVKYEGVLTVEETPVSANGTMFNDFFLLTDSTSPGRTFGTVSYEAYHHEGLHLDTVEALSNLPYISRVEQRHMTAGRSTSYFRLDTDQHLFYYAGRCILIATIADIFEDMIRPYGIENGKYKYEEQVAIGGFQNIQLRDVEMLAGREEWLQDDESTPLIQQTFMRDDTRDEYTLTGWIDKPERRNALSIDYHLFMEDLENLIPGRRYVFVLRNIRDNEYNYGVDHRGNYKRFIMADDTIIDWWPYYTDITDLPDNWLETEQYAPLRELIQVTNDDLHTFDIVYGDDMASIRRVADRRMICEEGRFLTPTDAGQPVCVVSTDFLTMSGLKIGDSITLDLGNYLCEPFASLGAVASTRGRYATEFTRQEFTIIGTWRDLNEGNHADRDLYWAWSNNAIFVPSAFLPDCVNAETYSSKPNDVSFVVGSPEEIIPFEEQVLPRLDEMGISYLWNDLGWSQIGKELVHARDLAMVKLLIFIGAAVLALALTVWLFIWQRKREYAIYRALGMPKAAAARCLYLPFFALGCFSTLLGAVVTRAFNLLEMAASNEPRATLHAPLGPLVVFFGALGFMAFLSFFAWAGIMHICRRSILELLSGGKAKREKHSKIKISGIHYLFAERPINRNLGGSRCRHWGMRYLRRLLTRNIGRSILSIILAGLLVFAFGILTVLRGIYRDLYQNVEVKPVISGGLDYERAVRIAESGYVQNPYYEYICKDAMVEMETTEIIFTNQLSRRVNLPILWQEGLDEEAVMSSNNRYCVITQGYADYLGLGLGELVRINENNWWNHVTALGLDPLKPGETVMERRDARRPFMEIAGLIQTDELDTTTYVSIKTWQRYSFLYFEYNFGLDIAEYTLLDYNKATEFVDYAKQIISRSENNIQFQMDTSYADQIYRIHRLIETLYPLAVVVALLLSGLLPGLIVLHSSREICILRTLGVPVKSCVFLYTMAQVLCALVGLVMGVAFVMVFQHSKLVLVVIPFVIYVAVHFSTCILGSSLFTWMCARKRVLELLQAKE